MNTGITGTARAGFPSPAGDYVEPALDFNAYLGTRKPSAFVLRVEGDCMEQAHIPHGSLVVVDRSVIPVNNSIIIATVNGERVIKYLVKTGNETFLHSADPHQEAIRIIPGMDFTIWGTVVHVIINIRRHDRFD